VLDAHVAAGEINVDGVKRSGTSQGTTDVLHQSAPGPAITLDLRAGFGSVAITTASPGSVTPLGKTDVSAVPTPDSGPAAPTAPTAPAGPGGSG
jgi:hypothetical protein